MPRYIRDWRKLQYREELFFRYFRWRVSVHDLDHSHYCKTLTRNMTQSQRCWFSLLFGMTYRTPQAYAYWWHFNDLEEINIDQVIEWNADNWKRTSYGTDARYNKGHFAAQTKSVIEWADDEGLLKKIRRLTSSKDPRKNFDTLFNEICKLYKFGRMTTWIACQCLYDTLDLPIDVDDVLVASPANDSSMQSIWNGYNVLKGRYDRLLGKYATTDYKVTQSDLKEVSADIMRYRELAYKTTGIQVDVFKWESIWCQFKRLFNNEDSREYPGHSSGDAVSRYLYYREHWPEVDWFDFREALLSQESIIKGQTYRNDYNKVFGKTGLLLNMHEMFSDMPNAYKIIGEDPNKNLVKELFEDHGSPVPVL